MISFYIDIEPMGAVRQVRGDTALAAKPDHLVPAKKLARIRRVRRYVAYKEALRALWPTDAPRPESDFHITFFIKIPPSRRRGRNAVRQGDPHIQRPDIDNLQKALLDALYKDDSHVWDGRWTKRWGDNGGIEVIMYEK